MFELRIDLKEVERLAVRVGGAADQIPFVMAGVLNDAAFATRTSLIRETWPAHVTQRSRGFPAAVLRVEKATKAKLSVAVYELESSVKLLTHAQGGTKTAKRKFAIPQPWWSAGKMTARGLRKNATARAIIERTPKRALRITSKGLFIGEHGRLRLAFAFTPTVKQPKDVPFVEDFVTSMSRHIAERFAPRMLAAMRTRR